MTRLNDRRSRFLLRTFSSLLIFALAISFTAIVEQPASAADVDYDFMDTWRRTDKPTADLKVNRTWMWGPSALASANYEPYLESPDGARQVQYFDKSRMEITDPNANAGTIWHVTNGLLARELITGQRQLGNNTFATYQPANINVAGDGGDPDGPTYATFNDLMGNAMTPTGWPVTQTVDRAGTIGSDDSLKSFGVTADDVGAPTNHTVASVFWDFMNSSGLVYENYQFITAQLFQNPFYATGYPLTEAYWTNVLVGGVKKQVLVQVFERRVLTYTPGNPQGWKVEAGNVGQHYHQWRYVDQPSLGDRANPVPFATARALGDGWTLTAVSTIPNATSQVLAENQFNDPPAVGHQFFIARVTAAFTGAGSDNFDGTYRLRAVGASDVSYSTFEQSCGVIPDEISNREVFSGGTITGNVCWDIVSSDAGSLVMYDDSFAYHQPPRIYFALH